MKVDEAVNRIESIIRYSNPAQESLSYLNSYSSYVNDSNNSSSRALKNTLTHSLMNHKDIYEKFIKLRQWYDCPPRAADYGWEVTKFLKCSKGDDISTKIMVVGAVPAIAGLISAWTTPMLFGSLIFGVGGISRRYFHRDLDLYASTDSVKNYKLALHKYKSSDRLFELNDALNFKKTLDTGVVDISDIVSQLDVLYDFSNPKHLAMSSVDKLSPIFDYHIELVKFCKDINEILAAVKTLKKQNSSVHIFGWKCKKSTAPSSLNDIFGSRNMMQRLKQYLVHH